MGQPPADMHPEQDHKRIATGSIHLVIPIHAEKTKIPGCKFPQHVLLMFKFFRPQEKIEKLRGKN